MLENKVYCDIETTGLSPDKNYITIIGLYSEKHGVKQLVEGLNLSTKNLLKVLDDFGATTIVGFNILRFDKNFIEKAENCGFSEFDHFWFKDLMKEAGKVKLKGGLKKIEKHLGIEREQEPLSVSQQFRLWNKWLNECDLNALRIYKKYNEEDIIYLPIIEQEIEKRKQNLRKSR